MVAHGDVVAHSGQRGGQRQNHGVHIYCKISWAERETSTEAKQLTQNGSADPPIVRARVLQSTYVLHLQNAFLAFWYLLCQELPCVTTFLSLFKWQCQVLKFV